jgi:hypothetical protein
MTTGTLIVSHPAELFIHDNPTPGAYKFSNKLEAISKFYALEG